MGLSAADLGRLAVTSRRSSCASRLSCLMVAQRRHGATVPLEDDALVFLRFLEARDAARRRFAAFSLRHAVFIEGDTVLACGSADNGRCGLDPDTLAQFAPPYRISSPQPLVVAEPISACAAGAGHTVLVSSNGRPSSCGRGAPSAGGVTTRSAAKLFVATPLKLPAGQWRIIMVSASANHCVFVTACGAALTSGLGAFGRLGHGNEANVTAPKHVRALRHEHIVSAAAGAAHSLFVTAKGAAYSCGQGEDGRLGLGLPTTDFSPDDSSEDDYDDDHYSSTSWIVCERRAHRRRVNSPTSSRRGSSTASSSLGLPLGRTSDRPGDVLRPRRVAIAPKVLVVHAAAGAYHSLFLTRCHRLFSCGHNDSGQLGHDNHLTFSPALVSGLPQLTDVAAGTSHTLALSIDGTSRVWGSNARGALGLGHARDSQSMPLRVQLPHKVTAVAAGGFSSAFLTEHGVFVCGANSDGQLGVGHFDDVYLPALRLPALHLPARQAVPAGA